MRKLIAAELVVFAAALTASHGTAADEPTTLTTVSVTGYYSQTSASVNFGWMTGGFLNVGASPSSIGSYGGYVSAQVYHALTCAKAYSTKGPGANQGPRPNWRTYVVGNYGWHDQVTGTYYQNLDGSQPTPNSVMIGGVTYSGMSFVFLPGAGIDGAGYTMAYLVRNIAHEWSHQWGL